MASTTYKLDIVLRNRPAVNQNLFSPGDFISGTVVLRNSEPLSLSELRITLYGQVDSLVFRKYVFQFAFAHWFGRGFLFQKLIVLAAGATTLPPGEHNWKFEFQFPERTEPMRENWERFMKWSDRAPFPGVNSPPHPLPPTMSIARKQTFGMFEGSISYKLDATMSKGPEAKWWSSLPQASTALILLPYRSEQFISTALKYFSQSHTIQSSDSEAIRVVLSLPRETVLGGRVTICLSAEDGASNSLESAVALEKLEVSLHAIITVRGRSLLWPEKHTSERSTWKLVEWSGGSMRLGKQPVSVDGGCTIPMSMPPEFVTFNVGSTDHVVDVKYTMRYREKTIAGKFTDVPLSILGPRFRVVQPKGADGDTGWFTGEVLNTDQYRDYRAKHEKSIK